MNNEGGPPSKGFSVAIPLSDIWRWWQERKKKKAIENIIAYEKNKKANEDISSNV